MAPGARGAETPARSEASSAEKSRIKRFLRHRSVTPFTAVQIRCSFRRVIRLPPAKPRSGAPGWRRAAASDSLPLVQLIVPGMLDQPPTRLHQPLLQTRQRPVVDLPGKRQPPPEISQVVGDQAQQKPDLVRPESVAAQLRHLRRFGKYLVLRRARR